jgi:hypothetical protein
MHTETKLGVVE